MRTSFHIEKYQEWTTLEITGSILSGKQPLIASSVNHIYITH
jgi:hypothetical protein